MVKVGILPATTAAVAVSTVVMSRMAAGIKGATALAFWVKVEPLAIFTGAMRF